MSGLTSWQARNAGQALDLLTEMKTKHRFDVCAYGSIDVLIGDDVYMRVEWDAETSQYRLCERFQ